ncbi:MAG: GWxTD domain-containing protein [Thermoanaerobaculia bacterium]|nr:GWxTD domain-containing protein [Thermoanaerobaculia bacterium]
MAKRPVDGSGGWRRRLAALAAVIALAPGGAAAEEPSSHRQLLRWAEGPVRWLLQPGELRELRRVRGPAEAANFVELFWSRRDPEPREPGNRFRATFLERVEIADVLYGEPGIRGSLTDRGRAMILLGAPDELRISSRDALDWNPRGSRQRRGRVVVKILPMEVWAYSLDQLPEVLAQALEPLAAESKVELTFVLENDRAHLSHGEGILDLVSEVALARPH